MDCLYTRQLLMYCGYLNFEMTINFWFFKHFKIREVLVLAINPIYFK